MSLQSKRSFDGIIVVKPDLPAREKDVALDKLRRLQQKDILEKDVAQRLKKRMEKVFEGQWSCIVGSSFGSFLNHVGNHYLQVHSGSKEIILFKSA